MPAHHTLLDIRPLSLLTIWAACRLDGYSLYWSPSLRRVVLRRAR
jgi:hypothetical protein